MRKLPVLLLGLCALATTAAAEVDFDSSTFGGLRARSIGPAAMSGRVAAVDAVARDPLTVYVGAASGGVWKSTDGALTFKPVFDDHPQSIGAVEIDPSDAETVWVGTGESWVRNSVSVGFGVFKTTDGGDNWSHVGLEGTERIGAIRVDPTDGDVVYVCATGRLWNAGEERGVYKTADGGETWKRVLYVDRDTGCADLEVDPQEPRIVYAAMWQFRREPDFFTSGGPGSGLYKSADGGGTWKRLEDGLPAGELGRIAVAVAPSRPSTVYATVEAEEGGGLYRSGDVGESWTRSSGNPGLTMRPFYFSELVVDPTDFRRVYKPAQYTLVSIDGGETFSPLGVVGGGGGPHADHHALWVNPENPHEILLGTDGGLYVSYDRANTWRHVRSLPISQFYHVAHDGEWPYHVMGGLQDNWSWRAPSRRTGGIRNQDWEMIGTGDGFWAFADPEDPDVLYTEWQGGQLLRVHRELGEVKSIKPFAEEGQAELRFNWNAPIHMSPNDPATIYYGSQFLHRTRDRGETWETISPDLTTNDPARQRQKQSGGLTVDNSTAENNATIYTISESPKNPAVIWTGSDDGQVHVTRDGGGTWTNVVANVPDLPALTWVSSISASPHGEATAFATFDGHRTGDMATRVYRTDDYGAGWVPLATEDVEGYAWVVKQDPVRAELLYLGTEQGLYLTLNGGRKWARFKENLPRVAVHDLVIHPTEHDVILATHGRGVYIIDDVTPLRALTQEILDAEVTLLPSRVSPMMIANQFGTVAPSEFVGETLPEAATIDYYLKKRHLFGDFKIEILDGEGELIATVNGGKRKGLNRAYWAMRLKPPKLPPATSLTFAFQGPKVLEDTYKVRLTKGKEVLEGEVELVGDPRSPHSAEDRRLQQETALELYDRLRDLTYVVESLLDLEDQADDRAGKLDRKGDVERLEAFAGRLEELRSAIVSTNEAGRLSGDDKLRENMGNLFGEIVRYEGRPSNSQMTRKDLLVGELDRAVGEIESYLGEALPALDALLEKRGLDPLSKKSREEWDAEEDAGGAAAPARIGPWTAFLPWLLASW